VEGAVFSLSAPAPAATAGTSSGAGRVLEELGIGSGAARLELDLGGERRPWGLRDRESDSEGKMGPTFGGENGGPLGMEVGRGNLEEYGKYRSV
jgi:hypothetical protein